MAGRFAEARDTSEQILRLEPGNAAALKIKGNAEYLLGQFSQATDTFINLLDRHPKDTEGSYMLGRISIRKEISIRRSDNSSAL